MINNIVVVVVVVEYQQVYFIKTPSMFLSLISSYSLPPPLHTLYIYNMDIKLSLG